MTQSVELCNYTKLQNYVKLHELEIKLLQINTTIVSQYFNNISSDKKISTSVFIPIIDRILKCKHFNVNELKKYLHLMDNKYQLRMMLKSLNYMWIAYQNNLLYES